MAEISKVVFDYMGHIKNVKLILDIAVFYNDRFLLVKYKDINKYDHQKGWFLPDDYFADGENPDDAAERVLNEQLGLNTRDSIIDHFESFMGDDKTWHLIFHYKLFLRSEPQIKPSEEIKMHEWFNMENLPGDKEFAHKGWARLVVQEILKSK